MLSIEDVYAGYGALDILNGVDLKIGPGEFIALMGPNGAGKSTLLKTIFGMTTFKRGIIRWRGENIGGAKSRAILSQGIGIVPQGRCNFPLMTVEENLEMASYIVRDREARADLDYVFGIFPILRERRAQLAGINPVLITKIVDSIRKANAELGITFLVIEHNIDVIMDLCRRIVVLAEGAILDDGAPEKIVRSEKVVEAYLGG